MRWTLERVTQPAIEPISLEQARVHLRAHAITAEDSMIEGLIRAAREWVEDYTGRALVDQTWRLSLTDQGWPLGFTDSNTVTPIYYGPWFPRADGGILLRKSPVLAVTAFASVDADGVETAIDPLTYQLREPDSKWPRLYPLSGFTWNTPLRITFRAGFADRLGSPTEGAEVVPVRFLQAMKLWVEANYDRDEKMMQTLLDVAERLIKPERSELQLA